VMIEERRGEIAERVAAGAALLDRRRPGWENVIDLNRLNMRWGAFGDTPHDCGCVLAQLSEHGSFGDEVEALNLDDPRVYGFETMHDDDSEWGVLDSLWTEEVKSRR